MKGWQKFGLATLVLLLIAGVRIFLVWREHNAPMIQKPQVERRRLTDDDVVVPRKMYIVNLKEAKDLIGKTVWMQSGYSLDYYPYVAHHVDFAHKAGALPSIQELKIQDIVMQKAPAGHVSLIPLGDKQVFAVFRMANDPNDSKEYATAIGFMQGSDSTYSCDDIFYYDDPHQMYKHWPADVWQAIDQHQVKPGMSELQTTMALGMMQQSDASTMGDRTVDYNAGGKKWVVSFQHDKATTVKQE